MRYLVRVGLAFAIAGCATAQPAQSVKAELKKTEDSVLVTTAEGVTLVTVTSKSGIGEAKLTRLGKSWPSVITIRLKLSDLESFGMNNGNIRFNTSFKSPKRMPYWKLGRNEKQPEPPDGTLEVEVLRRGDWFEITVPSEMTKGNPEHIDIGWIDAFRT